MTGGLKTAFAASADHRTRLLLLGSLPGEASLAARQYYANPTNQFWRLVGAIVGEDLAARGYDDRLKRLAAHGIGLWDVIRSARRRGSGDGAIRDHQANDLGDLLPRLKHLRAIGFNGAKAASIGRRQLRSHDGAIALIDLPSSSAAYCAMPFEAKRERWLALKAHVGDRI